MRGMTLTRLAAAVAAVAMAAASAGAAPFPRSGPAAGDLAEASAAPLVLVHGCHFDLGPNMARDPVNGTHYHDRQCNVVRVGPQRGPGYGGGGGNFRQPREDTRPYFRGNRNDESRRPRRGYRTVPPPPQSVCREQCRYVGPIKRCRTVCQ
jgi:hypothetical protein